MNEHEYELYDRNIRLWGKDNQKRLNNSKVLLINLTSNICELAKNLILSGVSLYLYDKCSGSECLVSDEDIQSNFFLSEEDIGHSVINVNIESRMFETVFAENQLSYQG